MTVEDVYTPSPNAKLGRSLNLGSLSLSPLPGTEESHIRNLWKQVAYRMDDGWPAASRFTSLVGGSGLAVAYAGMPARFTLVSRDDIGRLLYRGGTAWNVTIVGPNKAAAALSDHGDGTYTVQYCCRASGHYRVSVRLNGHHMAGSPFAVYVRDSRTALGESLSTMAQWRHTLCGLFHRWVAYLPLACASNSRRLQLHNAAVAHRVSRALRSALRRIAAAGVGRRRVISVHHANTLIALRPRACSSLAFWRAHTYRVLGLALRLRLARRALFPLQCAGAFRLWAARARARELALRRGPLPALLRGIRHRWRLDATLRRWRRSHAARLRMLWARRRAQHALRRWAHGQLGLAWRTWAKASAAEQVPAGLLEHAKAVVIERRMRVAWRAVRSRSLDRIVVQRGAIAFQRLCWRLLNTWNVRSKERMLWARLRRLAWSQISRARKRKFLDRMALASHARSTRRRAEGHIVRRSVSRALVAWGQKSAREAGVLKQFERAAASLAHAGLARAWRKWTRGLTPAAERKRGESPAQLRAAAQLEALRVVLPAWDERRRSRSPTPPTHRPQQQRQQRPLLQQQGRTDPPLGKAFGKEERQEQERMAQCAKQLHLRARARGLEHAPSPSGHRLAGSPIGHRLASPSLALKARSPACGRSPACAPSRLARPLRPPSTPQQPPAETGHTPQAQQMSLAVRAVELASRTSPLAMRAVELASRSRLLPLGLRSTPALGAQRTRQSTS